MRKDGRIAELSRKHDLVMSFFGAETQRWEVRVRRDVASLLITARFYVVHYFLLHQESALMK